MQTSKRKISLGELIAGWVRPGATSKLINSEVVKVCMSVVNCNKARVCVWGGGGGGACVIIQKKKKRKEKKEKKLITQTLKVIVNGKEKKMSTKLRLPLSNRSHE